MRETVSLSHPHSTERERGSKYHHIIKFNILDSPFLPRSIFTSLSLHEKRGRGLRFYLTFCDKFSYVSLCIANLQRMEGEWVTAKRWNEQPQKDDLRISCANKIAFSLCLYSMFTIGLKYRIAIDVLLYYFIVELVARRFLLQLINFAPRNRYSVMYEQKCSKISFFWDSFLIRISFYEFELRIFWLCLLFMWIFWLLQSRRWLRMSEATQSYQHFKI